MRDRTRLAMLHRWALAAPRHTPGVATLAGLRVRYDDRLSLYTEYKDIFCGRIYDFESVTPRPRVIDGGAHIGMSVLRLRQRYPGARVTCFEPDPQSRLLLEENLARNGSADVEVVPAALAADRGERGFVPDGSDGGRIMDGGQLTIASMPLSDYLGDEVDFLKLNIEGFEVPVLYEARARLPAIREMVIEYHGWAGEPPRLGELLGLLEEAGFHYLVNHLDLETNPAVRPPFRLDANTTWFALVYARRADLR